MQAAPTSASTAARMAAPMGGTPGAAKAKDRTCDSQSRRRDRTYRAVNGSASRCWSALSRFP